MAHLALSIVHQATDLVGIPTAMYLQTASVSVSQIETVWQICELKNGFRGVWVEMGEIPSIRRKW